MSTFFVVVSLTMTVQKSRTLIFGSALIVLQAFWWHFSNKTLRLSPQELICDTRVASCVIWPFLHQAIVTPSHVNNLVRGSEYLVWLNLRKWMIYHIL